MTYHMQFPATHTVAEVSSDTTITTDKITVAGGVVANTTASPVTAIFRDSGDSKDLLKINVPAEGTEDIPPFRSEDGLLVKSIAAGVHVTVFSPLVEPS